MYVVHYFETEVIMQTGRWL